MEAKACLFKVLEVGQDFIKLDNETIIALGPWVGMAAIRVGDKVRIDKDEKDGYRISYGNGSGNFLLNCFCVSKSNVSWPKAIKKAPEQAP